jgi:undecaprenyl-diphosphatase
MTMKKAKPSNPDFRHSRESGSPAAFSSRQSAALIAMGVLLIALGLLGWAIGGSIDQSLHHLLHVRGDTVVLRAVLQLTNLGGASVMIPVALLACAWLAARRLTRLALWLFATIAFGRILVEFAKLGFARPRPPTADWLTDVTSLSFPSSHAAGAMLTCLALCFAFDARRPFWWIGLLFAVAVGGTRVALGVHWPSDVAAGWGFGLAWATICARWLPRDRAIEA